MSRIWWVALAFAAICLAPAGAYADDQDCHDQHNTPCDTGQAGVCAAGLWKCSGNGLRCERQQGPVPEVCGNGADDDCDGASDSQDSNCRCPDADSDGYAACFNGCTLASGDQCGDCDDSRGEIHPNRSEVCNGRDDDCDDSVDEGNPGGGASCHTGEPGICDAGRIVCASGGLHCASNLSPRPEDCDNGLDDDCNGRTDTQDPTCDGTCSSGADADGDHLADCADNCPGVANAQQRDFDEDGTGDDCESGARVCDADLSGRVDGRDLALLGVVFGRSCSNTGFDKRVDLNRDCSIDGDDLAQFAAFFGQEP